MFLRRRLAFAFTLTFGAIVPVAAQVESYPSPDWYIDLTDASYSDFLIYTAGNFPPAETHEFISGEWGAAIGYTGIESRLTPPQRTMWLEPEWQYPTWTTNSAFTTVVPLSFPVDTDADGLPEGSSVISNGDVEVTIALDFIDTVDGTPMGRGGGVSVRSNRYVLLTTYTLRNIRATTLADVRFYQFLHGHPANDERASVTAVYDSTLYPGPLQGFRYDVTQRSVNSGAIDGAPTGCQFDDVIGVATEVAPAAFGLGHYRGHGGRPATGLHVAVENDTLGNQTSFGPDEVAGALRIDVGSIAPNATATVRVLLSVRSEEVTPNQVTADVCVRLQDTPGDPTLLLEKGPCGAAAPGGPFDVIKGQLNAILAGPGFTSLGNVHCVANDLAADRVTVHSVLSSCNPLAFVLARKGGGLQFDYGAGTGGAIRFPAAGDCAP